MKAVSASPIASLNLNRWTVLLGTRLFPGEEDSGRGTWWWRDPTTTRPVTAQARAGLGRVGP